MVELQQKYAELKQKVSKSADDPTLVAPETEKEKLKVAADLCRICCQHVFVDHKFILNKEKEALVAGLVYDHKFPANVREEKGTAHKKLWIQVFGQYVTRGYNLMRSNCQSGLRGVAMGFAAKHIHGDPHISMQMIEKCIERDINVDDPREMEIFGLYWTELLRKYLKVRHLVIRHLEIGHYFGQLQNN